jgi:hypothetical protein
MDPNQPEIFNPLQLCDPSTYYVDLDPLSPEYAAFWDLCWDVTQRYWLATGVAIASHGWHDEAEADLAQHTAFRIVHRLLSIAPRDPAFTLGHSCTNSDIWWRAVARLEHVLRNKGVPPPETLD